MFALKSDHFLTLSFGPRFLRQSPLTPRSLRSRQPAIIHFIIMLSMTAFS